MRAALPIVRRVLERHLVPLSDGDFLSVDDWLAHTSYSEKEKEVIRDAPDIDPRASDKETLRLITEFASFIKQEFYPEWKAARTIQGISPSLKKFLGPVIHAMEQELFKLPYFAKFVPVSQRARWLRDKFADFTGRPVAASDFTSFEQCWQRDRMEVFEFPLVKYLLSKSSVFRDFMRVFQRMEAGAATLVFKWLTVTVGAIRKSGTTNTSFSNGGGNWLLHEVLGEALNLGTLCGAFEGDDGLFCYSSGRFPTPADYESYGFVVKLEIHQESSQASFCGIVYHPEDCVNITDPVKVLNRIGWLSRYYARSKSSKLRALLRAKAMSLHVQSRDCPILAECAQWLLRATRSIDVRWVFESRNTQWWERQVYKEVKLCSKFVVTPNVPPKTRQLMEDVFGVDVMVQMRYEAWFRSQDALCPMPYYFSDLHPSHSDMAYHYVRTSSIPALDCFPVFPDLSGELLDWMGMRDRAYCPAK